MKIYLVGGAVRDKLLGLPVEERDWVVVGATPEAMIAAGFKRVGRDFPVFLHPVTHEEYALARTERKTAPGYRGFEVQADPGVSLEDDMHRRDLTINALAEDESGRVIDFCGGLEDLDRKVLRHTSPAFVEDPVRILRVARFAARYARLGFRVANETMEFMRTMVANGEADALVPERVWQELVRALREHTPGEFFAVLRSCGALAVIFPEIARLFGVPQPQQQHPEIDSGVHTMMVLSQAAKLSTDPEVRFAALTHDLGKGETPPEAWPRHIDHDKRGVKVVEALCERLKSPRSYRDLARHVARYHLRCHRAMELRPSTILKTLEALDAFRKPYRFEKFLLACEADHRGRAGNEDAPYPQAGLFRSAFAVADAIDPAPLIARGFSGESLAQEIRRQRLSAIRGLTQGQQ